MMHWERLRELGLFSLQKALAGSYSSLKRSNEKVQIRQSKTFLEGEQWIDEMQQIQVETCKIPTYYNEFLFFKP